MDFFVTELETGRQLGSEKTVVGRWPRRFAMTTLVGTFVLTGCITVEGEVGRSDDAGRIPDARPPVDDAFATDARPDASSFDVDSGVRQDAANDVLTADAARRDAAVEVCNDLDDDGDREVDEDVDCPGELECVAGRCREQRPDCGGSGPCPEETTCVDGACNAWPAACVATLDPSCVSAGSCPTDDGPAADACALAPRFESYAEVFAFGTNPGLLRMYRYTPAMLAAAPAIVVVVHGCGESAFAARAAGWDALAERHGFVVVYAEQQITKNVALCFNWASEIDARGVPGARERERRSILEMVERTRGDLGIAADRVFAAGFGAGGAMVQVLLAEAPEVFAAAATVAGIPYDCGLDLEPLACLDPGVDLAPETWADAIREAGGNPVRWPRVSMWHGTNDLNVAFVNREELVEQWTSVHGIDGVPDRCTRVQGAARLQYVDEADVVRVETWIVERDGHGVFVDPSAGCGTADMTHLDAGVSFAAHAVEFFGMSSMSWE